MTTSLLKRNVPLFLHESEFYRNLDDEDEEFTLNEQYFKADCSVNTLGDVQQLLSTLRFWGVAEYPIELLDFVLSNDVVEYEPIFALFWDELKYLRCFVSVMYVAEEYRLDAAISIDDMVLIRRMLQRGYEFTLSSISIAAGNGNLELFLEIDRQGNGFMKDAANAAVQYGHVKVLQAMFYQPIIPNFLEDLCTIAAKCGHLNCLQFLLQHQAISTAEAHRHILFAAVQCGHLDCFQYIAEEAGFSVHWPACLCVACVSGSVPCVQYALGKCRGRWSEWMDSVDLYVVQSDSLECVQFASVHGLVFTRSALLLAVKRGVLSIVQWLHTHNGDLHPHLLNVAAEHGRLAVLMYLSDKCRELRADVVTAAAANGHLDCLQFAFEHTPSDEGACIAAATGNHVECLQYLHERGCVWDHRTTDAASEHGSMECLQYAIAHGCPVVGLQWWRSLWTVTEVKAQSPLEAMEMEIKSAEYVLHNLLYGSWN